MKATIQSNFARAILLLFFIITYYSCKKVDTIVQTQDNRSYAEKFLSKPSDISTDAEAIIELLRKENEKNGFIEKLPVNAGIPVWDKFLKDVPTPIKNEAARGIIADKDGNYLIPLSNDKVTLSGVLFALYQEGKYNFYCYTNDYLYKICYSDHYPVPVKEKALALFMYMSNYVFGISQFKAIPTDLFATPDYKHDGSNTKYLQIKPVTESAPDTAYIETLKCVTICIQIWKPENCTCQIQTPEECDWCAICAPADCFGEWIPTDGGGVSFGDNTGEPPLPPAEPIPGGNGSGTNWIPPVPPCPGAPWYAKVPFTGSGGSSGTTQQNCDPSYTNPCGPDGVMIDNACISPNSYPGKEAGFPYFWWENEAFLQPYGGLTFGSWAIHYLLKNPSVAFATFQNWFMTASEGQDGDYDATYWSSPNLTFPSQSLPRWDNFKNAYPKHTDPLYDTPEEMYSSVGGQLYNLYNSYPESYQNTCALRISKALNYSGITIPAGPDRYMGSDGKYYFVSAKALLVWMKKTFGTPSGSNHLTGAQGGENGENFPTLLSTKKGIYIMVPNIPGGCRTGTGFCASGHADIIENALCDGGCYFDAQGGVSEIFIWELP